MKSKTLLCIAILKTTCCISQAPSYEIGEKAGDETSHFIYEVHDNNSYYLIRVERESKKAGMGFFEAYSRDNLTRKISVPLALSFGDATEVSILDMKIAGENVLVFYDYVIDKVKYAAVAPFNKLGQPIGSATTLSFSKYTKVTQFVYKYETTETLVLQNANRTVLVVASLQQAVARAVERASDITRTKPDVNLIYLNNKAEKTVEKTIKFDIAYAGIKEGYVDQKGNIYFPIRMMIGDYKDDFDVRMAIINAEDGKITYSYLPAMIGKKATSRARDLQFVEGRDGLIYFAGVFQHRKSFGYKRSEGAYVALFDSKTGTFIKEHFSDWTTSPEEKKRDDNKPIYLELYSISRVHLSSNNSLTYLMANNYTFYDGGDGSACSGKLLEIKTDPAFNIISMKYGLHGQSMFAHFSEYAWTSDLCTDNDSYFFYNDIEENIRNENQNKIRFITMTDFFVQSKPCTSHFSTTAATTRTFNTPELAGVMQTNRTFRISNSELLVPVNISNRISLMKIYLD